MNEKKFFSWGFVIDFLKKCNELNKQINKEIIKKSKIAHSTEIETLKKRRINHFYIYALEFFENRINFIIDCTEKEIPNIEILDNLARGMIEIYCRVLYLTKKRNENEKIKRIIWHELYLCALMPINPTNDLIRQDYKILDSMGLVEPRYPLIGQSEKNEVKLPSISKIRETVQNSLKTVTKLNELRVWEKNFQFPKVSWVIKDLLDENEIPKISKYSLNKLYSIFSEQMHANIYLEHGNKIDKRHEKFRITSFLALIYLKILRETSKNANLEKSVIEFIQNDFIDSGLYDNAKTFIFISIQHNHNAS